MGELQNVIFQQNSCQECILIIDLDILEKILLKNH